MTNSINNVVHISSVVDSYLNELDYLGKNKALLYTGIQPLDSLLGDLRAGEVVFIGGRPAMGKTTLSIDIMKRVACQFQTQNETLATKKCVLYFTWMSGNIRLLQRMLRGKISTVDSYKFFNYQYGVNSYEEFENIANPAYKIKQLPIYLCEEVCSIQDILFRIEQINQKETVSLIIIDSLQLIPYEDVTGQKVYDYFIPAIKNIAKTFNVPILITTNLDRNLELRDNRWPKLTDIKIPNALRSYIDKTMLIYREIYYLQFEEPEREKGEGLKKYQERLDEWCERCQEIKDLWEVIVYNKKNGRCGTVKLFYDFDKCEFYDKDT